MFLRVALLLLTLSILTHSNVASSCEDAINGPQWVRVPSVEAELFKGIFRDTDAVTTEFFSQIDDTLQFAVYSITLDAAQAGNAFEQIKKAHLNTFGVRSADVKLVHSSVYEPNHLRPVISHIFNNVLNAQGTDTKIQTKLRNLHVSLIGLLEHVYEEKAGKLFMNAGAVNGPYIVICMNAKDSKDNTKDVPGGVIAIVISRQMKTKKN